MAIIVSGASGGFGRAATEALLAKVAAEDLILTTRDPSKLAHLAERGVTIRRADFDEPASLIEAFRGGDRMLLISTARVGTRVGQHRNAIQAAVAAGVRQIAYTSIISADEEANPAIVKRDHRATERDLMASGAEWTILRDNQYGDAMAEAAIPVAYSAGIWRSNEGDGQVGFVARADCVACAAAVLTQEGHGNVAYDVTGPELLSFRDVAHLAGEVSGRPLPFRNVSDEEMFAVFDSFGVPREASDDPVAGAAIPWCSNDMVTFGQAIREGYMAKLSDTVERLTGRPATPLRTLLAAAAPRWPQSPA
ncbi:MAG: short chain dehydrogenase family protein [Sphingomonas bacterium]|nr:short chain dehydrogenase family protein [Sphingomonas bacterium]